MGRPYSYCVASKLTQCRSVLHVEERYDEAAARLGFFVVEEWTPRRRQETRFASRREAMEFYEKIE